MAREKKNVHKVHVGDLVEVKVRSGTRYGVHLPCFVGCGRKVRAFADSSDGFHPGRNRKHYYEKHIANAFRVGKSGKIREKK